MIAMRTRINRSAGLLLLLGLLLLVLLSPSETNAGIWDASGEVTYKEYWVPHSEFTGGCGENEKNGSWYLEPYLCEKSVFLEIPDDFSNALKAEIYLDLWRNGQLMGFSINDGEVNASNVGSPWSRTPYIGEIPLSNLKFGTNKIVFQPGGYHIHDIAIRIYYNNANPLIAGPGSDVTPPDGSLLTVQGDGAAISAGAGGNLIVDNNQLTLTADVSGGSKYVEFHAYYFGMDEDTDGKWLDWHNRGRNNWFPGGTSEQPTGGAIDHAGTVATPSNGQYSVTWDVSGVPDQDDVKFKIRVVDDAGNVREAAGGISKLFSLTRTQSLIAFWNPNFNDIGLWMEGTKPASAKRSFWMPLDYVADDYESGLVLHSFWHRAILTLNDSSDNIWPSFSDDDMWQMSATNFSPSLLWNGFNRLTYTYNNPADNRPGAFVEKPGPFFVLQRAPWAFDNSAPSFFNLVPEEGEPNVGPGTSIMAQIIDDQSGLDYSTLRMTVQGIEVSPNVTGARHTAQVSYRPPLAFEPNEVVEVSIEICDREGQCSIKDYTFDVEGELLPTGIVSDDFNSCTLDETAWKFRDPIGKTNYQVTGAALEINVPAGSNHDFDDGANDAPRFMQAINDEDFRISAKFDFAVELGTQMQGLIIAADEQNFIRYNVVHNGNAAYLESFIYEDGMRLQSPKLIRELDETLPYMVPTYLAVERFENDWKLLYMDDSEEWVELKSFTDYPMNVAEVGVFAGNSGVPSSTAPAFTSSVDFFFDDYDPIDPQDQDPLLLPVEIEGDGVVEKTPQCGNPVTLTATPAEDHFFQGWSSTTGTISGRTNPLTTSFITGETVTAKFHSNDLTLNVTVNNDGTGEGGSVAVSPDQAIYQFEDEVTLTAQAPTGWDFLGWSGDVEPGSENTNPLVIFMDDDINITANFAARAVTLRVDVVGMGSVNLNPDQGMDYQYGDRVTLTAVAADDWVFDHWEGDVQGSERKNPAVYELTADTTELTAVFKEGSPRTFLPVILN